jgi:hypothetical protein
MNSQEQQVDLGFARQPFPECCHVCLIFDDDQQRRKMVSEFLAAGLRRGELVRYIADSSSPEQIRSSLLELGVEIPDGAPFYIHKAEDFYCPSGRFNPQVLIDSMPIRYDSAKKAGYSGVRSCGEMSWALRHIPGSEKLLEYEALLSTVTATFPHIGMCQYDARLFDGATLFKVLQVHPYMVAHGGIVRNPFYIRPEEFLKGLASKSS